jgi:hypothetical protein
MGLRIEHRTEQGVMVLTTPFSLATLAARTVATGEELVVVNERTGDTLARFSVAMPSSTPPSPTAVDASAVGPVTSPQPALTRHGLDADWESLMTEVERRGWYVVPTTAPPPRRTAGTFRRVILGIGSPDSHLTVVGWGRTIVEALGWAMVRALDATASPIAA